MNCCNTKAVYVDNVPGKEYYYCRSCKQEVFTAKGVDFSNAKVGWDVGGVDALAYTWSGGVSTGPMALPTVAHPTSYPVPPPPLTSSSLIIIAIRAALDDFMIGYAVAPTEVRLAPKTAKLYGLKTGDKIDFLHVEVNMYEYDSTVHITDGNKHCIRTI